jgi:hypothetical protein
LLAQHREFSKLVSTPFVTTKEVTQYRLPKAAIHISVLLKRVLAGIVVLIATMLFLANAAGLVGIWIVRRPARDAVTTMSTFVNGKLEIVDQALARVGARVAEGRQALTRVNTAANNLADRLNQDSPMLPALTTAVRDDLAPRIADMRAQTAALHDGVVRVNAALETLDSFPLITVPTFSDELSAVSERVDAVQSDAQELRVAIDQARTVASANLMGAVTERTTKIENVMAQIKSTIIKYQTVVAQKREQVMDLSHRLLLAINLLVLSLTAIFLVGAASQALLIYVLWQYVRRGRFPVLRVA